MIAGLAQRNWYTEVMANDGKFKKGQVPWNQGVTGYMGANRTSFKKGDNVVPIEIRFWKYVQKTPSCWLWMGHKNNTGYGVIHLNGKNALAHRVSLILEGKDIEGVFVLHKCDTPTCVRPEHLFLGNYQDNHDDMVKKGRKPKGEQLWYSKLTMEKAQEIRKLYKTGNYTTRGLGKLFNVSCHTISFVINNKRWI